MTRATDFENVGWEGVGDEADLRERGVFLKTPVLEILEAALQ